MELRKVKKRGDRVPPVVYLVANGDMRLSANQTCDAAHEAMEKKIGAALEAEGKSVKRAHEYDPVKKHGFIESQKMGIEIFHSIPNDAPVIVAEAVWQYSHHILPGLLTHRGPILTVANWSGEWPGLVGLLNLNASLTKAGVKYSTIWSEDFSDEFFLNGLRSWLRKGRIVHDTSHARLYREKATDCTKFGAEFAREFARGKSIMGVFDEGCM